MATVMLVIMLIASGVYFKVSKYGKSEIDNYDKYRKKIKRGLLFLVMVFFHL